VYRAVIIQSVTEDDILCAIECILDALRSLDRYSEVEDIEEQLDEALFFLGYGE
jgi:hypothetical protein